MGPLGPQRAQKSPPGGMGPLGPHGPMWGQKSAFGLQGPKGPTTDANVGPRAPGPDSKMVFEPAEGG